MYPIKRSASTQLCRAFFTIISNLYITYRKSIYHSATFPWTNTNRFEHVRRRALQVKLVGSSYTSNCAYSLQPGYSLQRLRTKSPLYIVQKWNIIPTGPSGDLIIQTFVAGFLQAIMERVLRFYNNGPIELPRKHAIFLSLDLSFIGRLGQRLTHRSHWWSGENEATCHSQIL